MTNFGSMVYARCNSYYTPTKDVASSLSHVGVSVKGTRTHIINGTGIESHEMNNM